MSTPVNVWLVVFFYLSDESCVAGTDVVVDVVDMMLFSPPSDSVVRDTNPPQKKWLSCCSLNAQRTTHALDRWRGKINKINKFENEEPRVIRGEEEEGGGRKKPHEELLLPLLMPAADAARALAPSLHSLAHALTLTAPRDGTRV